MRDLAIWWLSQLDFESLSEVDTLGLPGWLRAEVESARGRNGRGRLWVSEAVYARNAPTDEPIVLWPESALGRYLEKNCAGIIVTPDYVPLLGELPGVVTDMALRRWRFHRPT